MMKTLHILAWFFLGMNATALEILWLELTPRFSFETLSGECSDDRYSVGVDPTAPLFFSAEVGGEKVRRARLSKSRKDVSCYIRPFPGYVDTYSLNEDEVKEVELFLDDKKQIWIKKLGLNSTQLKWVFSKKQGCHTTKEIESIEPNFVGFEFKLDTVVSPGSYSSAAVPFNGKEKGGELYKAQLLFNQKRLGKN